MKIEGEQILLRVYMRTTDQYHLAPAYTRLVQMARTRRMAGATVLTGIYGYGHGCLLEDSALAWSHDVPVIVELVDSAAVVASFITEVLSKVVVNGIVTLERAHVMLWRKREPQEKKARLAMGEAVRPLSTVPEIERSGAMQTISEGLLLRIFIGESDDVRGPHGGPLYKVIVKKARELGLRGATVLRGSMGYGANSVLHTSKMLELSSDLPIVIEIVDERERIEKLLPFLEETVQEGMMTMEEVRVLAYRHSLAGVVR